MSTAGDPQQRQQQQQQQATDPSGPSPTEHDAQQPAEQEQASQTVPQEQQGQQQQQQQALDDASQHRLEIDPDLVAASEALSSGFAPPSAPPAQDGNEIHAADGDLAADGSVAHLLHDGPPPTDGREEEQQHQLPVALGTYADDPTLTIATHPDDGQLADGTVHRLDHALRERLQKHHQQHVGQPLHDDGTAQAPLSAEGSVSAAAVARPKKPSQRGGPGGGSVNETGLPKPASQLRNEGKPPKGVTECASCGLKESPEWRKGESGLKDLCNACGLRHARLVAKRAGKIRPRKKKNKDAAAADGADGAESSKRGAKRARVSHTADGGLSTSAQHAAPGLEPALPYGQYGHGSTQQQHSYYQSGPSGDGGLQQASSSNGNGLLAASHGVHLPSTGSHSSPHQLPPIDTSAYAAPSSGGGAPFFNPMHSQLQQQQQMAHARIAASGSPAGYNSNGGAPQLPPLGGGGAQNQSSFYAPPNLNSYFYSSGGGNGGGGGRPFDTHAAQQQLQQQQQQHQHQQTALNQALAAQGGYSYYQPSHLVNAGTYDPQLGQQQQQQLSSQPHTLQQPLSHQVSQQQQQQQASSGNGAGSGSSSSYYTPSFPNYGYQMQAGHFPDGYASAQAQAAAAAAAATAGGGGASSNQVGSQQPPESEERGSVGGGRVEHQMQQSRAQEGAA